MSVIDIFLLLLILLACAAIVYMLLTLRKLNTNLDMLQNEIRSAVENITPILDNVNEVTEKVAFVTRETERQFKEITLTVQNVKDKFHIFDFLRKPRTTETSPNDVSKRLRALSKGFSTFLRELKS